MCIRDRIKTQSGIVSNGGGPPNSLSKKVPLKRRKTIQGPKAIMSGHAPNNNAIKLVPFLPNRALPHNAWLKVSN